MAEDAPFPEPDRIEGAPHPRETPLLFGQAAAEAEFLSAWAGGRMHHAWMLAGPRGVGKATLAYRIAKALIATGRPGGGGGLFGGAEVGVPTTLDIAPDHPVARRVAEGNAPDLYVLRRLVNLDGAAPTLRAVVTMEAVTGRAADGRDSKVTRGLRPFFATRADPGAYRVVIVDAADDLNPSAANAILKLLEEPPVGTVFLLVAHAPSRLLPTIRSRCRVLRCGTLAPGEMDRALGQAGIAPGDPVALAALAGGSVGAAARLELLGGPDLHAALVRLFSRRPIDRGAARALAEIAAQRSEPDRAALVFELIETFLARLARAGALGPPQPEAAPGEGAVLAAMSPDARAARHWAALAQELGARAGHGRAVNVDPAALVLDMLLKIDAALPARA
ncbi:MAG: DNA polymerase III subunit delta' [Shimia sp.]